MLSAGEALAEVVVAVAAQEQGEASGQKRPEALTARPLAVDGDGVLRKSFRILPGDLSAQKGAEGPVSVGEPDPAAPFRTLRYGGPEFLFLQQDRLVLGLLQSEIVGPCGIEDAVLAVRVWSPG